MTESSNSHERLGSDSLAAVLDKLGEIARAANDGSFVFRGEPKCYTEISSSLYREYKAMLGPFGIDGFDIRNVQDEILVDAERYTGDATRQDLLSQLQHYGHPTNLIDFTTDYLIALFFACGSEPNDAGRMVLLNTETNPVFRLHSPANRIKAQKSVFVNPPSGLINPDWVIRIPRDLKEPIMRYLRISHDITAQTIYDDVHGFIKNANIHRSAYAEFHIAGLHLDRGNYQEALEHYTRSIELNGYQKASFANRAVTFLRVKKYDEAISDFSQVIALDHNDARAHRERGQAYFDSGQPELAEPDFDEAIRLDERLEDAYIGRAACRVHREDFEGAKRDLQIVIGLNPDSSAAYNGKGVAAWASGDTQSAKDDLGIAIKIDPANPVAYMSRALLHLALCEYEDARDDFSWYIRLGGDDIPAARFRRGIAHVALGNYGEARTDLSASIGQDPLVAKRVIATVSNTTDGRESFVLPEDVPSDLLAMLNTPP